MSLARVHTITAALLGASLVAIAFDVFGTRYGRTVWADSAFLAHTPFVVLIAVILAGHLGISIALERRAEAPPYRTRALAKIQYAFLGISLAFVVVHLAHTWSWRRFGAGGFYDALMRDLGAPWLAGVYIGGVTAACFAIAIGGDVVGERAGFFTDPRQRTIVRAVAIALAIGLWVVLFDTMTHFIVGRALFFGGGS